MELFKLFGKVAIDNAEANTKLDETTNKASEASGKIGNAFKALGGVVAAGMAAGVTAVGALTKAAVESYAEYEQLVGGVETLFKDSSGIVQEYADNAYKTAGMSANDYMTNVTSFSASLLQGLHGDTAEAARVADMAITDMADNANKMGTPIENITVAYQGFAKQNYTMLDNLKLGYGGTKAEMERLLADATKLTGVKYDINNLQDVYTAIHVIQGELGITGTTAKEAASTIQGSLAMTKAAWANLLTAFANGNKDIKPAIDAVVESAGHAVANLVPVVGQALTGIAQFVQKIAPIISAQLPGLVNSALPQLLSAATQLVNGVVTALPGMLQALIPVAAQAVMTVAQTLIRNLPAIMNAATQIIMTLVNGLGNALPKLIPVALKAVVTIVEGLVKNLPKMLETGLKLLEGLATGIINALPRLISQLPKIITGIVQFFISSIPKIIETGVKLLVSLIKNLPQIIAELVKAMPQIIKAICEALAQGVVDLAKVGANLLAGLWDGIKEKAKWLKEKVAGLADTVTGWFKNLFGIHSPSKVFAEIGKYLSEGLGMGIEDNADAALAPMNDIAEKLNSVNIKPKIAVEAISNIGEYVPTVKRSEDMNLLERVQYTVKGMIDDSINDLRDEMRELTAIAREYMPRMANMRLVMDTGVVAGELTPYVDKELQRMKKWKEGDRA